jgi:hypothetical protein
VPAWLDVVAVLLIAATATVVAIRIGMLLAPRLDRMTQPADEDEGGNRD